jgi:hypothetical protein
MRVEARNIQFLWQNNNNDVQQIQNDWSETEQEAEQLIRNQQSLENQTDDTSICEKESDFEYSFENIARKQRQDPYFSQIIHEMEMDGLYEDHRGYFMSDGILWRSLRKKKAVFSLICIPNSMTLLICQLAHDSLLHPGFYRTMSFLKDTYYMQQMVEKVKWYIRTCRECNIHKRRIGKMEGYIQNILTDTYRPCTNLAIDFVGPLKISPNNKLYILHCICVATKVGMAEAYSECTAANVAKFLFQWVMRFGGFKTITSDNGKAFISEVYKELVKLLGAKPIYTSFYRPSSNMSERQNQTLVHHLKTVISPEDNDWDGEKLQRAVFSYNITVNASGYSPYELLYAFKPVLMEQTQHWIPETKTVQEYQQHIWSIREQANQNKAKAIEHSTKYGNQLRTKPTNYEIGDLVYCYFPNLDKTTNRKLASKYDNRNIYKIIRKYSPINYHIQRFDPEMPEKPLSPPCSVHVSRIKPYYQRSDYFHT